MRIDRFTETMQRRGRVFLVITGLLVITALVGIGQVRIDSDFSVFMPPDSPNMKGIQRLEEAFGSADELILMVSLSSEAPLTTAEYLAADLERLPEVESALGPVPRGFSEEPAVMQGRIISLMETASGRPLTYPRADLESSQVWTLLRIVPNSETAITDFVRVLEGELADRELEYAISGELYLQAKIFDYIWQVLLILPPAAVILLLGVFRFRIGSFRATILSMIPAVLGGVLTLGLLSWLWGTISVMTVLAPIFIIVLGSADGLHITSHVMDLLGEGKTNRDAINRTLGAVGVPVILTTVTTMAGFLSLMVIDSAAVRQMAVAAATGMVIAGLATWIVLPILLLHQKPLKKRSPRRAGRGLSGVFPRLTGIPAVVLTLVILGIAVPGTLRLHSDFSMLDMYKPGTDLRRGIELISDVTGSTMPVSVLFELPGDNPLDQTAAAALLDLHERLESQNPPVPGLSLYRVLSGASQVFMGTEGYPQQAFAAEMLYSRLKDMNPGLEGQFIGTEGLGRGIFFLPNLDDATLARFIGVTTEVAEDHGLRMSTVGTAFAMKELNDKIIPQQLSSLALAAVLVGLLTILTQRSLKLGLVSVLPILVTLAALFGFLGWTGTALSVVTSIMTGLTLGVGIDYAIHYISMYRYLKKSGSNRPAGEALDYVATPVLANALGLAVGFSVMILSPFQIHVTLSQLMWLTMVLSAFLSLSLLPTLLGARKEPPADQPLG